MESCTLDESFRFKKIRGKLQGLCTTCDNDFLYSRFYKLNKIWKQTRKKNYVQKVKVEECSVGGNENTTQPDEYIEHQIDYE